MVKSTAAEEESEDDGASGRDTPAKRSVDVTTSLSTYEVNYANEVATSIEAEEHRRILPGISSLPSVPRPVVADDVPQKIIIDIDDYETIQNPFVRSESALSSSQPTCIFDISDDEL